VLAGPQTLAISRLHRSVGETLEWLRIHRLVGIDAMIDGSIRLIAIRTGASERKE